MSDVFIKFFSLEVVEMSLFDEKINSILNEDTKPARIHYVSAVKAPWEDDWHDWIVRFDIDKVSYEYVLHGEQYKIFEWLDWKKKVSDTVLLNYAKKHATTVYKIVDDVKTKIQ